VNDVKQVLYFIALYPQPALPKTKAEAVLTRTPIHTNMPVVQTRLVVQREKQEARDTSFGREKEVQVCVLDNIPKPIKNQTPLPVQCPVL